MTLYENEKCLFCRFWDASEHDNPEKVEAARKSSEAELNARHDSLQGRCKRFPPVVDFRNAKATCWSTQPQTSDLEWCGEFSPRPDCVHITKTEE